MKQFLGFKRVGPDRFRLMPVGVPKEQPTGGRGPIRYYYSQEGLAKLLAHLREPWPDVSPLGPAKARVLDLRRFASDYIAPDDALGMTNEFRMDFIESLTVWLNKIGRQEFPIEPDECVI